MNYAGNDPRSIGAIVSQNEAAFILRCKFSYKISATIETGISMAVLLFIMVYGI